MLRTYIRSLPFAASIASKRSSRVIFGYKKAGLVTLRTKQASEFLSSKNISQVFNQSARFMSVTNMNVPTMGDSITEGTIVEWLKNPGEYIEKDDVLVVIETDKVSVDVRAEASGEIVEHKCEVGETVDVGSSLVSIDTSKAAPEGSSTPTPAPVSEAVPVEAAAPTTPAPTPAGPVSTPTTPTKAAAAAAAAASTSGVSRNETRVKMTRMRNRISERLKDAQNTAAMLTTFQEVDMGDFIDVRNKHKEMFEKKHGVKLGFMSVFLKASAMALQESPIINAVIDGDDIVHRDYVDISVAVSTPKGLVVPAVRNVESMSFADIEKEIGQLATKAREGTITVEDMAGGTFTVSNGGVYGSLMGTPILNLPQSAILGMHGTKMRPVVRNGEIIARPMMYLALTYDHRLVDGRDAVTFLCSVRDKIEDPTRMLLEL